ncbi:MAG TPA: single-stranded DNA-binding protein [Bellilinea sp.]|nr:single-stranded DNA-binding protein [Bellilinea sp.]
MNQIVLQGNLGRDPEVRHTPKGTKVVELSVADNRIYTGADGNQVKETNWFRVSVFGKQAEACAQYLKKGRLITATGRMKCDVVTNQDGSKSYYWKLIAQQVVFGPRPAEEQPELIDEPVAEEEILF